ADKLIFSKWREALGGNIQFISSGSAALQPRLARVFWAAGIKVCEGYGLTETSPVITASITTHKDMRIGCVGVPIDNIEVKIAEDGEILCKGDNVMMGYYKRPDLTDEVHPANIVMCERIAKIIGLDICGIDIMAQDLRTPVSENGGAILEVNAAPGFRMHIEPAEGLPRNVAEPVIDMLFPDRSNGRIPIIAITGTNGKTTTTRLTAHISKSAGKKVGYTTSDGVYIQNQLLMKGDCTGPLSSQFVLKDPTVDFAVLECARGGILKNGLAFQHCDVAIVTNVASDHMGLGGINTIEQMARVKAVVPETVFPHGYAVLNADDDLVYAMKDALKCNIALFSMDENNPRIQAHCQAGGLATVYENGYVSILKGTWKIRVIHVKEIPLTFEGKAVHNIANTLPSVMATYLFKSITIEDIRSGLQTFIAGSATIPGRLNFFHFKNFTFLADFAHNPHGLQLLCEFVDKLDYPYKVGVISGTGDRRDEDIRALGSISAKYFDEIIIRCDKNLRGRTAEEIISLLQEGINEVNPKVPQTVIANENLALEYVYTNHKPGALYTIMCDVVAGALDKIKELKDRENSV
ncbi:MAG: cyanophycin synthetase, partial [Bacteroidota bacterium]